MTAPDGLNERLAVYIGASKLSFTRARDTAAEAVQAMQAEADAQPTAEGLDAACRLLTGAALQARILAATLEEDRRLLLETLRVMAEGAQGGAAVQPESG